MRRPPHPRSVVDGSDPPPSRGRARPPPAWPAPCAAHPDGKATARPSRSPGLAIQRLWTKRQFERNTKGSGLSRRGVLMQAMDGQLAWYHNKREGGRAPTKFKIAHLEYLHGLTQRW